MSTILDKLEALDKAVIPGRWGFYRYSNILEAEKLKTVAVFAGIPGSRLTKEGELIVEMRNALPALLAVARASKAHADATVNYRLGRISEVDIAHYYNRLVKDLAALEQSE